MGKLAAEDPNDQLSENNPTLIDHHSIDDVAKGLATGTVSRRKALRLMASALVGAALTSIPGVAWAKPKPGKCNKDKHCPTGQVCVGGVCRGECPPCTAPEVPNPVNCQCECPPPRPSQCNDQVCTPEQVCIGGQCVPPDPSRTCTPETFGPGCNGDATCFCGLDVNQQAACYQATCGEVLACQPLQGCSSHSDCPAGTICGFLAVCIPACGNSCP
jgi:hypothetical protein